jgi:hypothetical protein
MNKPLLGLFSLIFFGLFQGNAQTDYPTNREITQRLQKISSSGNAKLVSLTKTEGGQDIWALQIGTGDLENKPAIAITGGVEGYHILSVEMALQVANRLLNEHRDQLEKTTFYIFPNMSPDAYAQYFSNMKYERRGNATRADHDRDGFFSEDGYEDLNKDGYITSIRIETPMGGHVAHEDDSRVMVKAEQNNRTSTRYMIHSEGIDNDKDGEFNEDPAEGVAFNKSLTYKFPNFQPYAGEYPVSQPETRALLDYLFDRWNIFAFVTFGPANNLSTPLKYNSADAKKRVVTSMQEKDVEINKMISEVYNETVTAKAYDQTNQGTDGDFFQWAYFHFGRLSFSTPAWWVPEMKEDKKDTIQGKKAKITQETNYLTWAQKEGINDVFVPWTPISHPDFPNQKVEVGGMKPFVMITPPYRMVDSIAQQHTEFYCKIG